MKINYQLFAVPAELEGIDAEVLELLKDEFPQEETPETSPQPEETPDVPTEEAQVEVEQEQEAPADADSDNKQVAENVPGNIPYARFKQQNDKLKSVEKELADLRARLEQAQQVPPQPVYQQAPVQQPTPADNNLDEREVMNAVTQEAIRRAKERLGLTDDDVSNLDFSDDIQTRYQFQTLVQRESNAILDQAKRNSQERIAREQEVQRATSAYDNFVHEFQMQPDAQERWQYISEERFLQLDQFEQGAIKSAFERLQQKQGTPGDYFLAVSYFNRASKEFDDKKKPAPVAAPTLAPMPKVTAADKIKQAQALPKAPNVQGAMSTPGMSVEDIAELMNKPGNSGIEKIPPDVWAKILRGEPLS